VGTFNWFNYKNYATNIPLRDSFTLIIFYFFIFIIIIIIFIFIDSVYISPLPFSGREVTFTDGSMQKYDAIVVCSGYNPFFSLPISIFSLLKLHDTKVHI
jgi:hypothetical protein